MRWLLIVVALAAGGCEGVQHLWVSATPTLAAKPAEPVARRFPEDMAVGQAMDIEIIRADRRHIVIDNRTSVPYHDVTLWLNDQWGAEVEEIPIGRGDPIQLVQFMNHHAEPFPVGSFLEPDKSRTVVLGDLQESGKIHKLLVRLPEGWQKR